ncbi:MAG: hypothetical protein JJE09_00760 [Bacteroidia bacterium]|nr:hypothetical protein [Bacteroidia bacterium]
MKNLNFSGRFANSAAKVDVIVGLFQFVEDGRTIIYSPAFDLSGYGNNVDEAKQSFEVTIDEFFNYTIHKDTLSKELKRLGWNIKVGDIKKRKLKSPDLANLIAKNDYLAEILNEKQFTKFDQTVSVPC